MCKRAKCVGVDVHRSVSALEYYCLEWGNVLLKMAWCEEL